MNPISKVKRKAYRRISADEDLLLGAYLRKLKKRGAIKTRMARQEVKKWTVAEVCSALGATVPATVDGELQLQEIATAVKMVVPEGGVFLAGKHAGNLEKTIVNSLKRGATAVFADEEEFLKTELNAGDYPLILVKDSSRKFEEFFRNWRNEYKGTVIGITGSVGKTTTRMYIKSVLQQEKTVFSSPANDNSSFNVADNIQKKMTPTYSEFIQEVGAARIGSIATAARMLNPDIAVVTNVKEHHLSAYKSLENVFADKIQMVEQLRPGGTAVVNFDDEGLAAYDYKCRVVSFGMDTDRDVTYRAANIRQEGDILHVDVLHDGRSTHVESVITGEHNAYNILAAFAVGKLAGISEGAIVQGVRSFASVGTRQNMVRYAGRTLYIDCYNVCNETIINSVKILREVDVPPGGRKIAIVGAENKLGKHRVEKTVELGEALADLQVDELVCYGSKDESDKALNRFGDPITLYNTLNEAGYDNLKLIQGSDELAEYISSEVRPGDAVLFKGIVYLNMPATIDKALGTGFCLKQRIVTKKAEYKTIDHLTGFVVAGMNEAYITDVDSRLLEAEKIRIPDQFDGHDVFGIKKGVFSFADMQSLDLGNTIKHIGTGAFRGCGKLEELVIPDSVMYIREGAFRDCKSLKKVTIGRGIRQIDKGAFRGCGRLKDVTVGNGDVSIVEGTFPEGIIIKY